MKVQVFGCQVVARVHPFRDQVNEKAVLAASRIQDTISEYKGASRSVEILRKQLGVQSSSLDFRFSSWSGAYNTRARPE